MGEGERGDGGCVALGQEGAGVTAALMVGLIVVDGFVDTAPPAGESLKIMGVPLIRAAADGDAHEASQTDILRERTEQAGNSPLEGVAEPSEMSLEETLSGILSRPDDPVAQESWTDAAIERHAEMRSLYRAFLTFKDSAAFRRSGFGAGG